MSANAKEMNFYFITREIVIGSKNSGAIFDYSFGQNFGFDSAAFFNFIIQSAVADSGDRDSVKAAKAFFKNFNYLSL